MAWSVKDGVLASHTELNDIGTKTHAQIDTAIDALEAATVAVRGGYVSGAAPVWQSASTVRIPSGYKAIDPDTGVMITAGANYDVVLNGANYGALKLDAAPAEAVSTWYYLWICSGASGTTGVWSTSATAPTLPSGYDVNKARTPGVWRNDAGSALLAMEIYLTQSSARMYWTAVPTILNGYPTAGSQTFNISAYLPPDATYAEFIMYNIQTNGTGYVGVTSDGYSFTGAVSETPGAGVGTLLLPTAGQTVTCHVAGSTAGTYIWYLSSWSEKW